MAWYRQVDIWIMFLALAFSAIVTHSPVPSVSLTFQVQVHFLFLLKLIDIARNVGVVVAFFDLFETGKVGVFINTFACAVGSYDFGDVVVGQQILGFTDF